MVNIVIPMAGLGSRFAKAGQARPKPLIEVLPGQPMLTFVTRYLSLGEPHRFVFVCRSEHVEDFSLESVFKSLVRSFVIATTDDVTQGPACTALLASKFIDNDQELLVAYCDDYLDERIDEVLYEWRRKKAAAGALLFSSRNPRHAYAVTSASGRVLKVAEKERISAKAIAGFYYFREGRDFVRLAKRMVREDRRAKGEFFVSGVYNEFIAEGKRVVSRTIPARNNYSMGVPADLERFRRLIVSKRRPARHARSASLKTR